MPAALDEFFLAKVAEAASEQAREVLKELSQGSAARLGHRALASCAKVLLACAAYQGPEHFASEQLVGPALGVLRMLRRLQGSSGLFLGDNNVESPPDSAFTIVDVADCYVFASTLVPPSSVSEEVSSELAELLAGAKGSLLSGGVHTPNHRWQVCAALASIYRSWPDRALSDRAALWLNEGVDIDAEGFYSERSPNYAAHVSNPSLILVGDVLGRDDLLGVVEANLQATLDLLRPDGTVETVQSRRQDQRARFSLSAYLLQFRRLAVERQRGDFSWAAQLAFGQPLQDPGKILAGALLDPLVTRALPPAVAPLAHRSRHFEHARLLTYVTDKVHAVVYGGSDYAQFRRVRSGLACNPTMFRMFAGSAVLDAVRFSRRFFGLGPFRASTMELEGAKVRLEESVAGAYYLPLSSGRLREDGLYEMEDEGRFYASMAFSFREKWPIELKTMVHVELQDDGASLGLQLDGPSVPWSLELTFRPGGSFQTAPETDRAAACDLRQLGEQSWNLVEGFASYRVGEDCIVFGPGNGTGFDRPACYLPGQDYTDVGGTDATEGHHVYITGMAPASFTLRLRAGSVVVPGSGGGAAGPKV